MLPFRPWAVVSSADVTPLRLCAPMARLRAHQTEVAGEAAALARLEELVQSAETLTAQQRAGVVATRSATVQRTQLREEIQTFLRFLAGVSVLAAKENADLAAQFLLPRTGASNQAFN